MGGGGGGEGGGGVLFNGGNGKSKNYAFMVNIKKRM